MSGRVDACIVAYQSQARIQALIPQLLDEPEISRVIVIDHGSDGSAAVAAAAGAVVVEDGENPGFGAGHNRAVALADTEYVLLINPDLVPVRGMLPDALEHLDAHPRAAAVQGVLVSETDGRPERSGGRSLGPIHLWGRFLSLKSLLRLGWIRAIVRRFPSVADHVERVPAEAREVEALAATLLLVRRSAFEEVGGFDPSYFLYGEDLDLCARWRDAGWLLWSLPSLWATHASGESSNSTWDRELVWWEGTLLFASKWWRTGSFFSGMVVAVLQACRLALRRPKQTRDVVVRLLRTPVAARRLR